MIIESPETVLKPDPPPLSPEHYRSVVVQRMNDWLHLELSSTSAPFFIAEIGNVRKVSFCSVTNPLYINVIFSIYMGFFRERGRMYNRYLSLGVRDECYFYVEDSNDWKDIATCMSQVDLTKARITLRFDGPVRPPPDVLRKITMDED